MANHLGDEPLGMAWGSDCSMLIEVGRPTVDVGDTILWSQSESKGRRKQSTNIHSPLLTGCLTPWPPCLSHHDGLYPWVCSKINSSFIVSLKCLTTAATKAANMHTYLEVFPSHLPLSILDTFLPLLQLNDCTRTQLPGHPLPHIRRKFPSPSF